MRLIVVTTCTGRKRHPVPQHLVATHLPSGLQSAVTSAWRERVRSAGHLRAATEIYSGRRFQEAVHAGSYRASRISDHLGGLGLIRGDEQIPSYTLSLVPESSEYIGARVVLNSFDVARWWSGIQRSSQVRAVGRFAAC